MKDQCQLNLLIVSLILCSHVLDAGCKSSSNKKMPINLQETLVVQKYSDAKPGSLDREIELLEGDSLRKALKTWLAKPHKKKPSWTNYVPKLVVRADKTMVNFVKNTVVLSVRESKEDVWTQYSWTDDAEAVKLQSKLLDFIDKQNDQSDHNLPSDTPAPPNR